MEIHSYYKRVLLIREISILELWSFGGENFEKGNGRFILFEIQNSHNIENLKLLVINFGEID